MDWCPKKVRGPYDLFAKPKPDRQRLRWLKESLQLALGLSGDEVITVSELNCLEEGCAPLEIVVGLLRGDGSQLQHKLHKPLAEVTDADLLLICRTWGLRPLEEIQPFLKESP